MPENKGLNRGGPGGQEGELPPEGGQPEANVDRAMDLERKQQQQKPKQQGGIGREPNLEDKQKIQPKHQVD